MNWNVSDLKNHMKSQNPWLNSHLNFTAPPKPLMSYAAIIINNFLRFINNMQHFMRHNLLFPKELMMWSDRWNTWAMEYIRKFIGSPGGGFLPAEQSSKVAVWVGCCRRGQSPQFIPEDDLAQNAEQHPAPAVWSLSAPYGSANCHHLLPGTVIQRLFGKGGFNYPFKWIMNMGKF